jgi:3-dehydroquinate synthase
MPAAASPTRLELRHPTGVTPVWVGDGALAAVAGGLAGWLAGRTVFLITTPRVFTLHGERLGPLLTAGRKVELLTVEEGEAAKTVASAERLWNAMLAAEGKRDSRVVALGGGSVGDLAGFAAGCFLRGVAVVQVPTTLLAQVDAAVGGKTGVDLPDGKNTVGLFHHPAMVVADTSVLATLPAAELRSGLVEVIKMAALLDPELFVRVERDLPMLLAGEAAALGPVVAAAAAAKIRVVERDPDEQGERRLLNFGHTLGHALESVCRYQGLRHGEAVGYGLLFAWRLSRRRGLPADVAARGRRLLERLDLPPLPALEPAALLDLMARDKKARESGLTWVLQRGLGEGEMVEGLLAAGELATELADFLRAPFAAAP